MLCKRCSKEIPKYWIQIGDAFWHTDCFYMSQGESYGTESIRPEAERQPPPPPVQKQRWWRRTTEHIYGHLFPARSVAQAISKLSPGEDCKHHQRGVDFK